MCDKKPQKLAVWLLAGLAALSLIFRAFIGRGFGEEAFFPAMAYRFLLGDKPLISEVSPLQFTGFLHFPFLQLYRALVPDLSGVMLWFRLLYVAATAGVALIVHRFVRSLTGNPLLAVGLAAFFLSLEPFYFRFNSHAILGERLFLIGVLWSTSILLRLSRSSNLVGPSCVLVSSVLAYPPLLYGVFAYGLALLITSDSRNRRSYALWFGIPQAALFTGVLVASFLSGYTHRYREFMGTFHSGSIGLKLMNLLLIHLPNKYWLASILVLALTVHRFAPRYRAAVATALVPVLFLLTPSTNFKCQNWMLTFGLLPALLYPLVRHRPETRTLLWTLAFPGITAALATACLSNAGGLMAGYGMTSTALVSLLFFHWAWSTEPRARLAGPVQTALLAFLVIANLITHPNAVAGEWMRDRGPNAGLWGDPTAAKEDRQLREALHSLPPSTKTLVSYPPESLDYLFTALRPLTPTVLSGSNNVNGYLLKHHLADLSRIDVFIRRLDTTCPGTPTECQEVEELQRRLVTALAQSHFLYKEFTFAKIYVRRSTL